MIAEKLITNLRHKPVLQVLQVCLSRKLISDQTKEKNWGTLDHAYIYTLSLQT